ncbi:MAG: histidine kinase [Saccharofermentans sp.]|nr:histidine kinase [Saccharofermentans sp.]
MFKSFNIRAYIGNIKLNKKFFLMYVFGIILPLVITDAFLFQSIYEAELGNQRSYRDNAIDAYATTLRDILEYDSDVATAIDLNKELNTFINTKYDMPYGYFNNYMFTVSSSFFATLSDINQDRIVIYSDNDTMMSGHYFHNIKEVENERWYIEFSKEDIYEAAYAYFDRAPRFPSADKDRFIYVRKMNTTKSDVKKIITIEHRRTRLPNKVKETPEDCSMYICCDDYVLYASDNTNPSIYDIKQKAKKTSYATVKDFNMYGNTFTIYAISEELTILSVIKSNVPITILLIILTLILPLLFIKFIERSITERISILGKAFGERGKEYFQPIKEISGSDEISDLMHNYNRIVEINNELTNTIYKDKLREQESDIARKNAELLALQSQINPHFLFNALESIRMHSILKGENETAEMVQRLAVMQRQNVEWHEDAVKIADEEELIDTYLQLQSYRFGDRISYNIEIDDDCKDILIPKLTLVTFVENACIHGIESKATQGWIFVRVYKTDTDLMIEVEDTGDGLEEKEAEKLQKLMNTVTIDAIKKTRHVGSLNACLRIKMMFKDRAKFMIETEKGIGTSIIISIPIELITEG